MAKAKIDEDLFSKLRAGGLRKRAARTIAQATDGRTKSGRKVRGTLDDLKGLIDEVEDRVSGGPKKRSIAAKKAAATRKRQAAKRSNAARKGARTRAKS